MTADWARLAQRLEEFLQRVERLLPPDAQGIDWKATAFRWRKRAPGSPLGQDSRTGYLEAVRHPHAIRFADLRDIDEQKRRLRENTQQFVEGRPANNVLLTGARGTGKSSLVKAALNEFAKKGLRLIEVDKRDLVDLPDIVDLIAERPSASSSSATTFRSKPPTPGTSRSRWRSTGPLPGPRKTS
jgi:predicted AAA+ superfamily ATPase